MATRWFKAALLLLLSGAVHQGYCEEEPSVQEIVKSRIITGFKEGCDAEATAVRNLGAAVKAAYTDMRRREGKGEDTAAQVTLDVKETHAEDNNSYTRRLTSFSVHSPDEGVTRDSPQCIIGKQHLKRVGVTVLSLADCPLIANDIGVALSAFEGDDCVDFVEKDAVVNVYPTYEGPPPPAESPNKEGHPGEPSYLPYWIELTDVDRAWQTQRCLKEVVVAVLDTGVAVSHPDLRDNIWVNEYEIAGNGRDDDRNGYIDDINGYDFYRKRPQVTDAHGHGTHCAGVIGAVPHTTIAQGVCKSVSIAGLRFMDAQGSGATSDAIEAINYAVEMDFHIVSNSWGGPDVSSGLLQAIKRSADIDQLFVAAAGNSGNNADALPEYPAAYKVRNIISVAATDESDRLANFSNYGRQSVHLAAPGVFIVSTFPPDGVKTLSGTSMATPVVSGIAAMLLSAKVMPVNELKDMLLATVERPRTLKEKVQSNGRVSAAYAVCVASHDGETETEGSWLSRRLKKNYLIKSAKKGC